MKKIQTLFITIIIMLIVSFVMLSIISGLTYIWKWQADKALIGITLTYILTGFCGGLFWKWKTKESRSMGRKMLEAFLISLFFMLLLVIVSVFILGNPFVISSRFLMIAMLVLGSTCLGRIL